MGEMTELGVREQIRVLSGDGSVLFGTVLVFLRSVLCSKG